jgi:hypothetical protein
MNRTIQNNGSGIVLNISITMNGPASFSWRWIYHLMQICAHYTVHIDWHMRVFFHFTWSDPICISVLTSRVRKTGGNRSGSAGSRYTNRSGSHPQTVPLTNRSVFLNRGNRPSHGSVNPAHKCTIVELLGDTFNSKLQAWTKGCKN